MVVQVIRILLDIGVLFILASFIFGKYLDKLEDKLKKTDSSTVTREEVYRIVNEVLETRQKSGKTEKEDKRQEPDKQVSEKKENSVKSEENTNKKQKKSNKKGKKETSRPSSIRATGNSKSSKKNSGVVLSANEVLSKSDRRKKIVELHKQGMEPEEIVKELNASIGEVRLVIDLNRENA